LGKQTFMPLAGDNAKALTPVRESLNPPPIFEA